MGSYRPELGIMVVEVATPGIGHLAKAAGCDFIIFDMEHSCFGHETIKALLRYTEAADLFSVVRPPSTASHDLARVLDAGAGGILVPMVRSAEHARCIVSSVKYPPIGRRGVAQQIAKDRYKPAPLEKALALANQSTRVWAQIETAEGVHNADGIAAVDGIDALWLGHVDLSCSLGAPGDFVSPAFCTAVGAIVRAAKQHGKLLGRMVTDADEAMEAHAAGFDLLVVGNDVRALYNGIKGGLDRIRARTGRES